MILRGMQCAAGRSGRSGALAAGARLPRHFASTSQVRLLSLGHTQRAGFRPALKSVFALSGSSRTFFWSSSKTPATGTPSTSPEDSTAIAENAFEAPAAPEQPPVETVAAVEPANALDAAPVSGTPPATEFASEVASSLPADAAVDLAARFAPLHYGDFASMGLASWSPAGICQWGMELLHVSTGLPWFWTIVGATVVSRLVILPFAIKGIRNAARMAPHQAEFEALREEINKARITKDAATMQRAVLKQQVLYKKIGVSIGGMMLPPLVQIPITLGMFFGVKWMCELPVEQLKWSGLSILPDLTVPDPTYVLPIIATIGMNVGLSLGMRDMSSASHVPHMINGMRVLSILGLAFMAQLPAGALVQITTSVVFMALQSLAFRIPAVRVALGIPLRQAGADTKSASMMESVAALKKWYNDKKAEALLQAQNNARRGAGRR